jgi:subfamily B ATP-binding cassette protein MsbA
VAILAVVLSFLAASFEGVSIGFLLSFLQSLTSPDAKPIQTGIGWLIFGFWESMHPQLVGFIEYRSDSTK